MNLREKYRKLTDEENNRVMDAKILDLPGTFSKYISVYKEANTGNICPFYSSLASDQAGKKNFF